MTFIKNLAVFLISNLHFFFHSDQVPGWEKHRNMSIPNYILPDINTTIIEPTTLCKEDDPLLLIVFVLSSPDSFENR